MKAMIIVMQIMENANSDYCQASNRLNELVHILTEELGNPLVEMSRFYGFHNSIWEVPVDSTPELMNEYIDKIRECGCYVNNIYFTTLEEERAKIYGPFYRVES